VRTAYDEIIATAVKRQNQLQRIISELLAAELSEKRARSIKYQMTIAKLPLAKDIDEFDFEAAEVNETLIRDLATGDFLDHQRNLVLIGGTGKGKTHLAVSIACPSSDNLEHQSGFCFGGSGSSLIEFTRFQFGGSSAA
jgi:DNA replication protein DnaC